MISLKPYLIRSLYEWIIDSNLTPHFLVDTTVPGAIVPEHLIQDGKITLNLSPNATSYLEIENHVIQFYAKFSGVKTAIEFPPAAVIAVYAKENGQGMLFDPEPETSELPEPTLPVRPKLTVVK